MPSSPAARVSDFTNHHPVVPSDPLLSFSPLSVPRETLGDCSF